MVSSRKRSLRDVDAIPEAPSTRSSRNASSKPSPEHPHPHEGSLLHRIRNSWQFANLCQWIYIFGKAVKIDDSLDIDDLEAACLSPDSAVLRDIGLSLLKWVSSHRGLTLELFDEYTRRQYVAKAPDRNPFGTDEIPAQFIQMDIIAKLSVLHQLTRWVMFNPDRIRDKMGHPRDIDQASWRIEAFGWDSKDRTYFVLDDNRLYRMTDPPPAAPPKKNTLKAKAARRASKRRRTSTANGESGDADEEGDVTQDQLEPQPGPEDEYDRLGGMKWECIAVTLSEVNQFISTLQKTRDENEKVLRSQVEEFLVPILEKQEESRKRKSAQRERDLLALEKMAHAKRSNRIASRMEQKKVEERARGEAEKRRAEEKTAAKEEARRAKIEKERDVRLMSREQRLKERETRRLQHEEEIAQISEDSRNRSARQLDRRLQRQIERNKQALKDLQDEEGDWIFDCICGVYGHVDDGTHSVACERCGVWQHSKCLAISEEEADKDNFNFVCSSCVRRQKTESAAAAKPRPVIKLKVGNPSSPPSATPVKVGAKVGAGEMSDSRPPIHSNVIAITAKTNSGLSGSSGNLSAPDVVEGEPKSPLHPAPPQAQTAAFKPSALSTPGLSRGTHLFSSPHPTLSPPQKSPVRSRAYSSIFEQSSPISRETPNGSAIHANKNVVLNDGPTRNQNGDAQETTAHDQAEIKNRLTLSPTLQQPASSEGSSFSSSRIVGVSPTKFSPPPRQSTTGSRLTGNPLPSVLPPVVSLSHSLPKPILTPPVKKQTERILKYPE